MRIALVDHGMSEARWRVWLEDAPRSRATWLADAMVSKSADIRAMAAQELQEIPGLLINYQIDSRKGDLQRARSSFLDWVKGRSELFDSLA